MTVCITPLRKKSANHSWKEYYCTVIKAWARDRRIHDENMPYGVAVLRKHVAARRRMAMAKLRGQVARLEVEMNNIKIKDDSKIELNRWEWGQTA